MIYEDIFSVPIFKNDYKSYRVSCFFLGGGGGGGGRNAVSCEG